MHYALLIYEDESVYGPDKSSPVLQEAIAKHRAFRDGLGASHVGGAGLKPATVATTVHTRAGAKTVHDGPFAESKEQLASFHLIEAPDLDAAIAIARRVPLARDGAIEIRPLLGPPPAAA